MAIRTRGGIGNAAWENNGAHRTKQREEHAYGSYINKEMIKLVGQDIPFEFDVIDKDREEYKKILIEAINKLDTGKIRNQKR